MNYLAHLFLSHHDEALTVGNFLGDYISNKQVAKLPLPYRQGVFFHRRIDSFTDRHPCVRKSVRRLRPRHGRYAPAILDVLHDYILSQNWHRYCPTPLPDFAREIYEILERHLPEMPRMMQKRLPRMVADDWLTKYGTEDGLRYAVERMKLRSSKPAFFDNAVESLQMDYTAYEDDFNLFFPDVIDYVENLSLEDV
ncbi:MAG: ACP phosphodiesterase [Saprospiraceae bacterium]